MIHGAGITFHLAWSGFADGFTGPLPWPVVVRHLLLPVPLALAARGNPPGKTF